MKRKNLASESGAIMLEVVAVLSLMGLMGTMLFRQMYVRNQELHNIQMASEIRVVKDAYASWIQAQGGRLGSICPVGADLRDVHICDLSDPDIGDIKTYLPEGYFSDENGGHRGDVLKSDYVLKLVGYRRGTAVSNILTYYGVVIPTRDALPDKGEVNTSSSWSFRRAARIAMLIGIDGGAYDKDVTINDIAGAVGTWHLPVDGLIEEEDKDIPTYVAITGTDVFQPEVDLPSLRIGLPNDWSLALRNATAYGYFSAGGTTSPNCYEIAPSSSGNRRVDVTMEDGAVAELTSDSITAPSNANNCRPAFFVEAGENGSSATGNVHVLNDLTVGHDYVENRSAMRFDKDGMIVFETADVADPQNPGSAGNPNKVNYKLDPKYTSVMNDIKLMSRGGASLSEILPNYILKENKTWTCPIAEGSVCDHHKTHSATAHADCWCALANELNTSDNKIAKPDCPRGYAPALIVSLVENSTPLISEKEIGGSLNSAKKTVTSTQTTGCGGPGATCIEVTSNEDVVVDVDALIPHTEIDGTTYIGNWIVYVGYATRNSGELAKLDKLSYVWANLSSYCVFDPKNVDWNSDGAADGADNSPTKTRTMDVATCGRIKAADVCANMGCEWNAGCGCVNVGGSCPSP